MSTMAMCDQSFSFTVKEVREKKRKEDERLIEGERGRCRKIDAGSGRSV